MKATNIFFLFALMGIFSGVDAKVWRVNNNPGVQADFTTAQDAHDGAEAGDTLYFEGSPISYANLILTKKLVIVGPGYYLNENIGNQSNQYSAKIGFLQFYYYPTDNPTTTSEGSVVKGMYIGQSQLYIYVSNITLIGNCINAIDGSSFNLYNPIHSIIIMDNVINGNIKMTQYDANNILISNNIIYGSLEFYKTDIYGNIRSSSGIINNNIISGNIETNSFNVKNNILISSSTTVNFYNSTITNNISISNQFGTDNENQANVDIATIFVGTSGNTTDSQWKLKEGSPAIGAGEDGADCGIFGGPTPYVLSGIPNIPSIYYLNISNMPNSTLKVNVKARAN